MTPYTGPVTRVRVLAHGDGRFRIWATPTASLHLPKSSMVTAVPDGA